MKLTWHIVAKDLRSQAWGLAIWITLLAAKVAKIAKPAKDAAPATAKAKRAPRKAAQAKAAE